MTLSVLVGAAPASGQEEIAPAAYARVNTSLAETHVVPRYALLATATRDFATAANALCVETSDAGREQARAAFHQAMDAWNEPARTSVASKPP